jgi:hypothetical protein
VVVVAAAFALGVVVAEDLGEPVSGDVANVVVALRVEATTVPAAEPH